MSSWFKKLFSAGASPATAESTAPSLVETPRETSTEHRRRGNRFLDEGKLPEALACYRQAVALDPHSPDARTSLGFALQQSGELEAAQAALEQALALQPDSFDAAYLLGQICTSRQQPSRAAAYWETALGLQPDFEPLYGELCQALFQAGALDKARSTIASGIQRFPQNASFQLFLGNIHFHQKDWGIANAAYAQALRLDPALPQAYGNLATIFQNQEDWQQAVAHFDKALDLDGRQASFHIGRATCLFKLGQVDAAVAGFLMVISIHPDAADAHQNLGYIYLQLARNAESETHTRKALSINPRDANALNNLGALLLYKGKFLEAEKSFQTACALDPTSANFHSNLGGSLVRQGRLPAAIASYRKARELDPLHTANDNNLLLALSVDPNATVAEYMDEARGFGERLSAAMGEAFVEWPIAMATASRQPLRVGLISSNLCNGVVGYFLEGVVAHTDPRRIQLVAYNTSTTMDALSQRMHPHFAQWDNIFGMQAQDIARKIHADGIHILVDLNGHADGNSLPVFALKPAPLQVSWLGYWASTGLPAMDFVLADTAALPPEEQNQYTERVHYMPQTRFCFTPPPLVLEVSPPPSLRQRFITFGSYQSLTKIHAGVLAVWGRVLQAVPHARLHLTSHQVSDPAFQQQFHLKLEAANIDPSRVTLAGPLPRAAYLASYAGVDILLDTFPYAGGTTTCEALWMGVPTLTLRGNSMIARQGASMLGCVGLHDWIAEDEDDYVAKASAHASDIEGLHALRMQLRERALASALFDAPSFARDWEDALFAMWQKKQGLTHL